MAKIGTDEWRDNIRKSLKGRVVPEEQKERMRKAAIGKLSPMAGKHHSFETKLKIGKANKGNTWNIGRHPNEETRRKMRENNANWKGDEVGYHGLHAWVKRYLKRVNNCEHCGLDKRLELANKSQKYKRDLTDWLWLCRKCHCKYDNIAERAWVTKRLLLNYSS